MAQRISTQRPRSLAVEPIRRTAQEDARVTFDAGAAQIVGGPATHCAGDDVSGDFVAYGLFDITEFGEPFRFA